MLTSTAILFLFLLISSTPLHASPIAGTKGRSSSSVHTPIGTAQGVSDVSSVARFSVKYANAGRWQSSSVVSSWSLPNGLTDPSALPNACPQQFENPTNSQPESEDCLSMILYVPTSVIGTNSKVPTFMWIHGGSFIVGSANAPGLDGSALASATNSIVAVIQYRLGTFGFLPPSGAGNLAVGDSMNALRFLQKVVPSFGGDTSKITIAGQSSGATMVRALLATPSASPLFHQAIIQSDPMDFGFLSTDDQSSLQGCFASNLPCSATDTSCLNGLSTSDIVNAQGNTFGQASGVAPAAGAFEPFRPVHDGSLITNTLDLISGPFPNLNKPVLVTTVQNEAGKAIYGMNPSPVPNSQFPGMVNTTFGSARTTTILASPHYSTTNNGGDARVQLQTLGTDYLWKCSSWTFARNYLASGGHGRVFAGMYVLGATYVDNTGIPFCTQGGVVCHEDDIMIVFGTVSSPSSAQQSLITEMQARYKAFLHTGNPNPSGHSYPSWPAAATINNGISAIQLGASQNGQAVAVDACDPSFWGEAVQYDYQFFSI